MSKEEKTIYLIDGNSFCYRAYYAIRDLSTSKGMPTNAIYGVINMLRKLVKEHDPGMMTVIFDMKGPTKRHEKYEEYKIHRKPMPDELSEQMPRIKEVISAYNIPISELEGYEADDIIATLAEKAKEKGFDVVIVTGDKDALQLIDKNVKVLSPYSDMETRYGRKEVMEKYGVCPDRMIELMALAGDATDNVPGVKGIGKVTAEKLINEYGSVENIYKNIDKVKPESVKKKLEEGKEMAELSRELVILDRKVPVKLDVKKVRMGEPDLDKLSQLFREFEFEKLLREIMPAEKEAGKYHVAGDGKSALDLQNRISRKKKAALSVADEGIAFSFSEEEAYYVPLGSGKKEPAGAFEAIKAVLEDENIEKIGYDLKKEFELLHGRGIEIKNMAFDVMIAGYLLDPSRPRYDLEGIALRNLGYNLSPPGEGVEFDKKGQGELVFSGDQDTLRWCERSDIILRLHDVLEKSLKEKHLLSLFKDVEMPLVRVIADMEEEGVGIDVACLKRLSREMKKKLDDTTKKIYELAGEEFNINSPKQLQVILFDKLGLPRLKRTKTGASTDESVLTRLAKGHELPAALLEYRAMSKLKSGYYDSILELVDKKDEKLHANFNQAVTATGRLSSSEPNLQNIPVKTAMGKEIRRAFVSGEEGKVLLAADYSQIELRVLAHLSDDKNLIEAFRKGEDIHRDTASRIFGCKVKDVTDEMRSAAKTVNFGITYGMSSFRLARDLEIDFGEAQSFIDSYFNQYSGVKKFMDRTVKDARKKGFVTTLLNRRRYVPEITSKNERLKSFAERVAINTPVQGSAADLIKLAMIACHEKLKDQGIKMLIQVHDELVFKVPESKVRDAAKKVKEIMENVISLKVPLKIDIEAGKNWLDMEGVDA